MNGVADLNRDGYDDLLLNPNVNSGVHDIQYQVSFGQSDGGFIFSQPIMIERNVWWHRLMLEDLNQDGNDDLAYYSFPGGGASQTHLKVLVGNGDGTFAGDEAINFFSSPHGATSITFGDFDESHTGVDIFLSPDDDVQQQGLSHIAISRPQGDYVLEESIDFDPLNNGSTADRFSASAVSADIDLDGYLDIVGRPTFLRGGMWSTEIYWGNGKGQFSPNKAPGAILLNGYRSDDHRRPYIVWGLELNHMMSKLSQ